MIIGRSETGEPSRRDVVTAYATLRDEALSLGELEQIRLVLRGGSVIDWYRLDFERADEVERFVQRNGFDLDEPRDVQLLDKLRADAAEYLSRVHGYKIPPVLLECDVQDLPLYASEVMGTRRHRMFSCILLKVMHIIHHITARELRFRLRISHQEVDRLLIDKVQDCAQRMRTLGFPILDFSGGMKRRDSMIAKLLVKRENLAVEIHDRVRFRFVVADQSDILPTIRYLAQELIPFNYVVPGQTQNDLIDFTQLLRSHPLYRTYEPRLQLDAGLEDERRRAGGPRNEFSGSTFRVINFVVDVPLQVPAEVTDEIADQADLGRVIFALAEFQVIDAETARLNDRGENAHHRYKARQRARERKRLERGMRGRIARSIL